MVDQERIAVVTVTYGRRWHLLKRVIETLLGIEPPLESIVVVDNGSEEGIREKLAQYPAGRVVLVSLPDNTGSANGFKEGLRVALEQTSSDMFWLLDDDNVPQPGSLAALLASHKSLGSGSDVALLSSRSVYGDRFALVGSHGAHRNGLRQNAFSGFHVADVPWKLWSRLHRGRSCVTYPDEQLIECGFAPYGGLLVHRQAVLRAGFPDPRFFVYADDVEFSLRLRQRNVRIYRCAPSVIHEIDSKWYAKLGTFCPHLSAGADGNRVYYLIRNSTFVELRYGVTKKWIFLVNMFLYVGIGVIVNLVCERSPGFIAKRLRLLGTAIRDGWSGRLGPRVEA